MSRLEELMQELCPDGVEYVSIKDVAEVGTGSSNGNEAKDDGQYPFFIRSQTIKKKNEYEYDEEAIIIPGEGGIGDIYHYVNGKYALHQRVYRVHFLTNNINVKFAYYYFSASFKSFIQKKAVSATVTSIRKPMIETFSIPVPPLKVQGEIVRILDNFTELMVELTTELTARKQEYEYYCYELLTFPSSSGIKYTTIGNSCFLEKGNTPIQKAIPGRYPLVVTTEERKLSDSYQFDKPSVCIPLISSRGHGVASLNKVYYQEGKFALGNILCAVTPKDESELTARFLAYYLNCKKDILLVPLMKGGANVSLNIDSLSRVKVPVPTMDIQLTTVRILSSFTDYEDSLKHEIDARQKQYEYYRDKLLTFKEKSA